MRLHLREDLRAHLAALTPALADLRRPQRARTRQLEEVFNTLAHAGAPANANAQIYREAARRRTFRLAIKDGAYFVKLHYGVGWREIAKNLFALRRPVLGARNEFVACQRLRARGVPAPRVAGFGVWGWHSARQRSFVVCDALDGFASMEALAGCRSLTPLMRRRLLLATAALLRAMHAAGVHHRDCYAAHILANAAAWAAGRVELAVIDLHRARVRNALPRRWRRRDLAALLFSASAFAPTKRELARFARAYGGEASPRDARLWRGVLRRAAQLRRRAERRGRPAADAADHALPSVADFGALGQAPAVPFRFDVEWPSGPERVRCVALLRWQTGRGFTARASVAGQERLLSAFFGFGRARRLNRAVRRTRGLAAAGVGNDAFETGRCGGARLLLLPAPDGKPATADDLPRLLEALARVHQQRLRPLDSDGFRLDAEGVRLAHWQAGPLRRPRRRAIERDLARLIERFADDARVAEAVQRYCDAGAAKRWPGRRVDVGRVARHMAARCATRKRT